MEDNLSALALTVPYQLIEALNGIMGAMLLWMLVFGLLHLLRTFRATQNQFQSLPATIRHMYRYNKPEIALMVIVFSLFLRNAMLWYLRFMRDHHITNFLPPQHYAAWWLIITSGMLIIGVSCWIRVISPMRGRQAVVTWFLMVSSALAFGIGMALVKF